MIFIEGTLRVFMNEPNAPEDHRYLHDATMPDFGVT